MNIIPILLIILLSACGRNQTWEPNDSNSQPDIEFGTDASLDIITWNLRNFPYKNQTTIDVAARALFEMDVDIAALQEIESTSDFNALIDQLNTMSTTHTWAGQRENSAYGSINLALIYKEDEISPQLITEILTHESYFLPRSPLLMEFTWNGLDLIILNNHFKANEAGNEDEYRRIMGCNVIKEYLDQNYPDRRVILLGDLNDELTDPVEVNVFQEFIDDNLNYSFVDMEIANGSYLWWSYPSYPSHIDHIMISNELFSSLAGIDHHVRTIRVDDHLDGGWAYYYLNVSDHRPVGLRLEFAQ